MKERSLVECDFLFTAEVGTASRHHADATRLYNSSIKAEHVLVPNCSAPISGSSSANQAISHPVKAALQQR